MRLESEVLSLPQGSITWAETPSPGDPKQVDCSKGDWFQVVAESMVSAIRWIRALALTGVCFDQGP